MKTIDTGIDGKDCKVQFRKPVTVNGRVFYLAEINKFQVVTFRGVSLIDPADIIMIEENRGGYEHHVSDMTETEVIVESQDMKEQRKVK